MALGVLNVEEKRKLIERTLEKSIEDRGEVINLGGILPIRVIPMKLPPGTLMICKSGESLVVVRE